MKSVMQKGEACYLCGKWGPTETHHVFNGPYRKKSEEDGFTVRLHSQCHRFVHDHPETAKTLKKRGQKIFELSHSREEFIERYGKSYL